MSDNLRTRNSYALGLTGENKTRFTDASNFSDGDLGKLSGVIVKNIDETRLLAAGVDIPEDKKPEPVLVAAKTAPKTKPKSKSAQSKNTSAVTTEETAKPEVEETATSQNTNSGEEEEKERQARIAKAQKELEEQNKAKLANEGITANTEAVEKGAGKGGLFGNINGIGDIFKLLMDLFQKFIVGPNVNVVKNQGRANQNIQNENISEPEKQVAYEKKPEELGVQNLQGLTGVSTDGKTLSSNDISKGVISSEAANLQKKENNLTQVFHG